MTEQAQMTKEDRQMFDRLSSFGENYIKAINEIGDLIIYDSLGYSNADESKGVALTKGYPTVTLCLENDELVLYVGADGGMSFVKKNIDNEVVKDKDKIKRLIKDQDLIF